MEFKGTKGKWERVLLEETEFYTRKNEIHYGKEGECIAEFVHNDYDALLISKAPEMLDMLQKCKEYFLLKTDAKSEERADAIGQLIKEATEI